MTNVAAPGLDWRAGRAAVDITPREPIRMGGYGARTQLSTGGRDPLMAKALAIETPGAAPGVIVTTDLIGVDAAFADTVLAAIRERTGVEPGQVLLNYSHTHAGPILGIGYPHCFDLSAAERRVIQAYSETLRQSLVELVVAALDDRRPARLSWSSGVCSFAMNRRRPTAEGVINAPNPRGYVDRSVPVLRVDDASGTPRAVLFGYSCHNTTLGSDNLQFSADYAGFAQRLIERTWPGAQAMFLQGCGASANPYPRGTYELACRHGETLGAEVCRMLAGTAVCAVAPAPTFASVRGPLCIAASTMDLPLEPLPGAAAVEALRQQGGYYVGVAKRLQALREADTVRTHYRTPVAVWQFGSDLTLVRLSGEVVGGFIPLLDKALGPLGLWIAGYCADYFGYVPTRSVYREGGYEAHDFITGVGYLDGERMEAVVLRNVRRLAKRAGRTLPVRSDSTGPRAGPG